MNEFMKIGDLFESMQAYLAPESEVAAAERRRPLCLVPREAQQVPEADQESLSVDRLWLPPPPGPCGGLARARS